MLQYVRRCTPRDGCRNHDTESANRGGGRDAEHASRRPRRTRRRQSRRASAPSCGRPARSTRRRPVGSGPPMMATMPALAVTALLHERATATARCADREGGRPRARAGATPSPGARSTARLVAGSQPTSSRIDRLPVMAADAAASRRRPERADHRHDRVIGKRPRRSPYGVGPGPGRPTGPRRRRESRAHSESANSVVFDIRRF